MSRVRVADLLAHLEELMPAAWAEPWDRVGLLVGDPAVEVLQVFASLDPTPAALRRAGDAGAQVLLTHHPAFLEPPLTFDRAAGMAGVAFSAAAAGIALVAQHTNLDRAPEGADALPQALGLVPLTPLETSGQPVVEVTIFVPPEDAERVRAALGAAGAGRIGLYAACSHAAEGVGRYTPLKGAAVVSGVVGRPVEAAESMIVAVCSPDGAGAAVEAVREAHPYEEPVILTRLASIERGVARMGRVCEAPVGSTVGSLASAVSRALGVRATVWGDADRAVSRVATAPGSGRSLVGHALASGCDVFVTGELRYHEALDALASGLAVIEAGHDATEWPLVKALADAAARTPGLPADAVLLDRPAHAWWTVEEA